MAKKASERVETVEEKPVSLAQQKIYTLIKEIKAKLIERDDETEMCVTAMVCHEHVCMEGPPGTGKSFLIDAILAAFDGPTYSELMMKDLPQDVVFGPVDIPRLLGEKTGQSEYVRLTKGYLPEARLAFMDEIWKSGPAVLNRNLKLFNERKFRDNGVEIRVPLITVFAASNEWPNDQEGGKELGALLDRFLFRKAVKPIATPYGRQRLLWERDHRPQISVRLTEQDLHQARQEALALPWTPKAKEILERILKELNDAGIVAGDRRQYKAIDAAMACAYVFGAKAVEPEHLEILQHVLWNDPVEQPKKAGEIIRKLANPIGTQINQYLMEAQTIIEQTNINELDQAIGAQKKLKEIGAKLKKVKETDRQKQAIEFIEDAMKNISKAAMAQGLLD